MATQVTVITGEGSTSYSVSTGARGPAGATGPEGTINNSSVNTAIATNPSATRTAAGLVIGTDVAAQGDTRIEPQVKSSSFTASNGETYHVVASATVTDPSPVEGKGFSVLVRNGTATIGGTAYATAGTVIIRTFHSGTWVNHVYRESAYFGTAATTASTDYATAAQGTDERVPTAAGLTSKFSTADAAIVDADRVAVFDSTASFAPKHVLWSLIVSTLTTAFNALYVGLTGNQTVAGDKTLSGVISMTSTTRPTSAGTGTPAATSLITRADGDARYGGPFYDLDGSASHSESAATTPVKTVVLPVGTYLIECARLAISHTDTTSRTVSITVNFTGGTATMQDRGLQSHAQSATIAGLTYTGQGGTLNTSVSITNASPSFGAGAHYFTGRIVVTAETTLRIFGFCSVTPTNAISYETSGILRKIA